jgi:uncharacterized protein (TIGR00369 family)
MFDVVRRVFLERIPFNKVLGVEIVSLDYEEARIKIRNRDDLVGNYIRGSLHGGVVSAVLDLAGGLVAFMTAVRNSGGKTAEESVEKLANVGTIDIRVDYLRPGLGLQFLAASYVLRAGNKVTVTRMELTNDEDDLIAVATGAYLVG